VNINIVYLCVFYNSVETFVQLPYRTITSYLNNGLPVGVTLQHMLG